MLKISNVRKSNKDTVINYVLNADIFVSLQILVG